MIACYQTEVVVVETKKTSPGAVRCLYREKLKSKNLKAATSCNRLNSPTLQLYRGQG